MGYSVKDILHMEVIPALGCTEPAAVGLCAAAATSLLPDKELESVEVWLDPNIYKNALGVAIPGTRGEYGIDLAAAMGAFGGDPKLKLEVFKTVDDATVKRARDFVAAHAVKINLLERQKGIYIKVFVKTANNTAEAVIEGEHDNINALILDGLVVTGNPLLSRESNGVSEIKRMEEWISGLTLDDILHLLDEMDEDDLKFIDEGVKCNMALAEYGLKYGPGLGIGLALERLVGEGLLKKDMILAARILTSAASDARMSGVSLPAMSSAGSGNHGLVTMLPIWAVKDYIVCDNLDRVFRAIALSHMVTAYIKAHTGRLSAVCGCSVAAGAGAASGITYLMNGNARHISSAIKNLVEDLAGIICDGAKAGCSLKLATAAGTAVQSALFALHGIDVKCTDGIIASTPEQTLKNVGELSVSGMVETDRAILKIMLSKQFNKA
jgi:L-cysteine desulfidase